MTELFEALDESGQPTGLNKTKLKIIRDRDWRKVIHIWLIDNSGNLLIQQRAHGRGIFDDLWDVSVGGGVSAGEQTLRAAKRELKEELGLDLPESAFHLIGIWKMDAKPVRGIGVMNDFSYTYVVKIPKIVLDELKLAPREVQAVDIISVKDLSKRLNDPKFYAEWVPHGQAYYQEESAKLLANLNRRMQ
jgi:isopentenyl-diphosphate Delta-isomerase